MIGVYDSGVGGLSVWKELVRLMPDEDYVYFSDAAYCPYGPKDPSFIIERACAVTDFFLEKGCKLIVVACNTATAAAISYLREHYTIPFVGMEPAIKPARVRGALIYYGEGKFLKTFALGVFIWSFEWLRYCKYLLGSRPAGSRSDVMFRTARNVMRTAFSKDTPKDLFIRFSRL